MRARFILVLTVFVLFVSLAFVESYSQEKPPRALSWDQLLQLWKEESANRLPKNRTRQLVDERGVDFMLDSQHELDLRNRNFSIDFINDIRKQIRTANLTIKCEPVECAVRINGESVVNTAGGELSQSATAGPLSIEVSAPHFQSLTETIDITPGRNITRTFRLQPLRGGLIVTCEPADCSLWMNGSPMNIVSHRRWELNALLSGEYEIEVRAEGYKSEKGKFRVTAPETTAVTLRMDVDKWARLTASQLFDRMIQAIGNELLIKGAGTSKSSGNMTLTGDPAGIGNWKAQLIETTMPGKQRWDLKIAGNTWTVAVDGMNAKSKGNKRYSGTEFGQELEHSIRLFSSLRLPSILPAISSGFRMAREGNEIGPILVAESSTDRYTFRLNKTYFPQKLLHDHLTIPRSSEEMEFGEYREVQSGIKLPHVMILRYPDRPMHEQTLDFDRIDVTAVVKVSTFKP
jgi:hypothetical protein